MSKRPLSQTPEAQKSRERRLTKQISKAEAIWNAEVKALMDTDLSFDDAWVAAGGSIIPIDAVLSYAASLIGVKAEAA